MGIREFIAVENVIVAAGTRPPLKQQAIIFDRIGFPLLGYFLRYLEHAGHIPDNALNEINWLLEKEIIFDLKDLPDSQKLTANADYQQGLELEDSIRRFFKEFDKKGGLGKLAKFGDDVLHNRPVAMHDPEIKDFFLQFILFTENRARLGAIHLRELENLDAYPILRSGFDLGAQASRGKTEVVRIVLNAIPIPDETTSWEHIIEYRSDPDSTGKFLDLRNWMSEVAKAEITPIEIEEKLEHLISQYQRHMNLHRMKTNIGTVETIVVTGAEFLGDLLSFKWGKAMQALFSIKRQQVALLEGELTSPGSEVAYIVKARETFS